MHGDHAKKKKKNRMLTGEETRNSLTGSGRCATRPLTPPLDPSLVQAGWAVTLVKVVRAAATTTTRTTRRKAKVMARQKRK